MDRRDTFLALRDGRRGRAGPLTVSWLPGSPGDPPRVAFAVGRRVGNAVVRNRIRRRLRTLLRDVVPSLPPGAWLVAAAPHIVALRYDQMGDALTAAVDAAARGKSVHPGGRR